MDNYDPNESSYNLNQYLQHWLLFFSQVQLSRNPKALTTQEWINPLNLVMILTNFNKKIGLFVPKKFEATEKSEDSKSSSESDLDSDKDSDED